MAWASAGVGGFELIVPPDKSYVEGELISVVANVDQARVDDLQITVNDKKQQVTAAPINRNTMCYAGVRLSYGMNKIKISGYQNGKQTGEIIRLVYFHSDILKEVSTLPAGFTQYLFHSDNVEKACSSCHSMDFLKSGEGKKEPDRSPCYVCHKNIVNYKFVHGPTAVWACTLCHKVKSEGSKLAVAEPVSDTCSICHEFSWNNKKYMHPPTEAGMCITCHNPHASDKPYFLRLKTNHLCTSCHEEVLSQPHVITGFSGQNHPLEGRPDPSHPGKELMCTSCHNPHGENSEVLLNGYDESESRAQFCMVICFEDHINLWLAWLNTIPHFAVHPAPISHLDSPANLHF